MSEEWAKYLLLLLLLLLYNYTMVGLARERDPRGLKRRLYAE